MKLLLQMRRMARANDQRPTTNDESRPTSNHKARPTLIRGIGVGSATALNMIDMIGVGPFITIPLIVGAMGGPQAMLGWILGAVFAMCDGLVWAELGAAMPGSGGSYHYLREIYGSQTAGPADLFSFHLAAFFQCAAVHRLRRHRAGGLRLLFLARTRTSIR